MGFDETDELAVGLVGFQHNLDLLSANLVRDGRVQKIDVETAGAVGERVRVVSGLEGGEEVVVTQDDSRLNDGTAVAVGS